MSAVAKKHPIIPQNPVVPTLSRDTRSLVSREFDRNGKISEVVNLTDHARKIQELGADPENIRSNNAKAIFLCLATAATIATSAYLFFHYIASMGTLALIVSCPILAAFNYSMITYTIVETMAAFTGSSPEKLAEEWVHIQQERGRVAHTCRSEVNEVISAFSRKKASLSSFMSGSRPDEDVNYRLRKMNTAQHEVQSAWNWIQG
ncbi:MAG TPA: hypothetical protein VLG44_04570 [Chlamydiales bacterium]|nr:hypothetical protein [Chlamydiales bacterium]